MMASAFKRMQMAVQDKLRNHVKQVQGKLDAAGISVKEGGYPANANESAAYSAGAQRGRHWAYCAACRNEDVAIRYDMADSTSAGAGEQDGWNQVAKALGATE